MTAWHWSGPTHKPARTRGIMHGRPVEKRVNGGTGVGAFRCATQPLNGKGQAGPGNEDRTETCEATVVHFTGVLGCQARGPN